MRQPRGGAPAGPDTPPRPRPAHAGPPAAEEHPTRTEPPARGLPDQAGLPVADARRGLRPLAGRLRPRTVRARIVSLLMVPVVSLMALWAFATVTTAQNVDSLIRLKQVDATLLTPVAAVVTALQAERTAAALYLAAPDAARYAALTAQDHDTDGAIAVMDSSIQSGADDNAGLAAGLPARLDALTKADEGLAALRVRVGARTISWQGTMAAYAADIQTAFGVDGSLTAVQDTSIASDSRVLLELSQARELLAREDAAVQSGLAAGRMSPAGFQEFTGALYARQLLSQAAAPDLRPADRTAYLAVADGPSAVALGTLEDAVRRDGTGPGLVRDVGSGQWARTAQELQQQLAGVESAAGAGATAMADPYSLGVFTTAGEAVLFGLLAVIVSLLISVRIGRGLVVELVGLRNSALELAGRRLPAAMRRLRAGEEIDVDAEAPVVDAGDDELGQVGEALNTVQRAALHAAVERAEVLSGVSGVFVNLARRSQVLVHRQLMLLDAMERRTEDPSELEDLFRLDHLTTRMRRHAEGLIILSGAVPGRAWRKPVPLLDVVRSAVAEVEDYSRVEVRRMPQAAVVGAAVADLTHLIAELVENATGFSPPHTRVLVSGEQVGTGYALEIEDRGLGMGPEIVAEANRRIADAQQTDLFDSDRLGLFVVSRLARRHNIRVSLRQSPYGGTTAVLLLPNVLLQSTVPVRSARGADPEAARGIGDGERTAPVPGASRGASPAVAAEFADAAEDALPPLEPSPFRTPRATASDPLSRRFPLRETPPAAAGSNGSGNGGAPRNGGGGRLSAGPGPVSEFVPEPAPELLPEARPEPGPEPESGPTPVAPVPAPTPVPALDDLPRRVRQASLNIQLREAPAASAQHRGGEPRREPEDARSRMSALQEGWSRGRRGDPAAPQRHLKIHSEREAVDGRDDEPLR